MARGRARLKELPEKEQKRVRNEARRRQRSRRPNLPALKEAGVDELTRITAEMRKRSPKPEKRKRRFRGTGKACGRCSRSQYEHGKGGRCPTKLRSRTSRGRFYAPRKRKDGLPLFQRTKGNQTAHVHVDRL